MHFWPGLQGLPQRPQLAGSSLTSLQMPLQHAGVPGAAQRALHWPQLAKSLSQFTHVPSQQYWPLTQLFEQLPQNPLPRYPVLRLTQTGTWVSPKTHVVGRSGGQRQLGVKRSQTQSAGAKTHFPAQHCVEKSEQGLPHAPQLLRSVLVSTHVPPQKVFPLGQTHMPTTHWRPPVHWASLQQPSDDVHKVPVAKQHALPGQQFWPPGQFTPGAQVQQSARRFPLASKSKRKAMAAANAPARIMPSLKRYRREPHGLLRPPGARKSRFAG
jgi:hypothetical protein